MDADRKGFVDVSDYCFVFFISSVTQAALKLKKKREKNPAPQGAAYENGKQYELAHHRHTPKKKSKTLFINQDHVRTVAEWFFVRAISINMKQELKSHLHTNFHFKCWSFAIKSA